MKKFYPRNWWTLTVKGLFAFITCILAIASPAGSTALIAAIFGIILMSSGMLLILSAITRKVRRDRAWNLTEGFLDIIIATVVLSFHSISSGIFITMVTVWISFIGILQVSNRYRLNGLFNHWGYLIFNCIMAVLFNILMFTFPVQGLVTRGILITLQAGILIGFITVSSFHIKKLFEDIRVDIPNKEGDEGNQELSYF